jgi:drug/metabolite transporter (DMT)-like permease
VAHDALVDGALVLARARGKTLSATKIIAIVLIVAGVLALVYGGFSFTKESHEAKIGPLQFSIKEKETINIPVWAGVGAIAVGVVLLLVGPKK